MKNLLSNKQEVEYLQGMGFKKKYFSDKSGWWLSKKFGNKKFLKKVEVTIDEGINTNIGEMTLIAWNYYHQETADLSVTRYSREELNNLIKFIEN